MVRAFAAVILVLVLLTGCSGLQPAPTPTPQPVTVNVSAAASLTEAFQQIGSQFEAQHPGAKVVFNFGGSQQLAEQIAQGAPVDVFASANKKQMDAAVQTNRISKDVPVNFVQNRLVVVAPAKQAGAMTRLDDLARPGLKIVLGAKEVPVGQYAFDFLDKADKSGAYGTDFKQKVLANVASYEQDVKAVVTKVSLGEADAGVVYATDAASAGDKVASLAIPDDVNVVAVYPMAALADSKHAELAKAFVDFVRAPQGQAVLSKIGFQPIAP